MSRRTCTRATRRTPSGGGRGWGPTRGGCAGRPGGGGCATPTSPGGRGRAAALALDRELLRELLGQEELRDLIDPGALEQVEADLQRTSERTRADGADALHDVLRRLGDLTDDELVQRSAPGADVAGWIDALAGERRALRIPLGGEL